MLTRRAVLTGTAAASIAAIANARGVAAAPAPQAGFGGCGYGNLDGGAAAVFQKYDQGFSAFVKYDGNAAEVFFKESAFGKVDVFVKVFDKGWSAFVKHPLDKLTSLDKAEAYFQKVGPHVAEFFVKVENQLAFAKIEINEDGLLAVTIDESHPEID